MYYIKSLDRKTFPDSPVWHLSDRLAKYTRKLRNTTKVTEPNNFSTELWIIDCYQLFISLNLPNFTSIVVRIVPPIHFV